MLRGNCPATIDAKGRLKIPNTFRRYLEDAYGREFYITSHTGEFARIYPMPVWVDLEKKLASAPSMTPAVMRFVNFISYYGQSATMDEQGRLLIQPLLRDKGALDGAVAVLGNQNYLDVWSRERFEAMLSAQPLSDEDRRVLAGLGL